MRAHTVRASSFNPIPPTCPPSSATPFSSSPPPRCPRSRSNPPRPPPAPVEFKPTLDHVEFQDGDTFVFLGDSITHQCLYTQYVEDFFYTRFPKTRVHFHNAGVGGDRAQDALNRFDEDVAAKKPKYVTILLGMNDGGYTRYEQAIFDTYQKGMTTILDKLGEAGAAAIPMTPTMFDSRAQLLKTNNPTELKISYYNGVLSLYGSWLREQAYSARARLRRHVGAAERPHAGAAQEGPEVDDDPRRGPPGAGGPGGDGGGGGRQHAAASAGLADHGRRRARKSRREGDARGGVEPAKDAEGRDLRFHRGIAPVGAAARCRPRLHADPRRPSFLQ